MVGIEVESRGEQQDGLWKMSKGELQYFIPKRAVWSWGVRCIKKTVSVPTYTGSLGVPVGSFGSGVLSQGSTDIGKGVPFLVEVLRMNTFQIKCKSKQGVTYNLVLLKLVVVTINFMIQMAVLKDDV